MLDQDRQEGLTTKSANKGGTALITDYPSQDLKFIACLGDVCVDKVFSRFGSFVTFVFFVVTQVSLSA